MHTNAGTIIPIFFEIRLYCLGTILSELSITNRRMFTGGALVYEHRGISKLKVSGRDLKKFIEVQKKK